MPSVSGFSGKEPPINRLQRQGSDVGFMADPMRPMSRHSSGESDLAIRPASRELGASEVGEIPGRGIPGGAPAIHRRQASRESGEELQTGALRLEPRRPVMGAINPPVADVRCLLSWAPPAAPP